jgi:hypothetical protein
VTKVNRVLRDQRARKEELVNVELLVREVPEEKKASVVVWGQEVSGARTENRARRVRLVLRGRKGRKAQGVRLVSEVRLVLRVLKVKLVRKARQDPEEKQAPKARKVKTASAGPAVKCSSTEPWKDLQGISPIDGSHQRQMIYPRSLSKDGFIPAIPV